MRTCSNVGNNFFKSLLPILALALFASSCSNNPAGEDPKPTGPALLSVAPANAAPGVTLAVSGATVDTSALASYRLLIGGQQVLLLTDTLGRVSGIAPAFFKDSTSTWPSPSATPLDIELFKDTVLVGRGVGIFTSDSLIQVPGSTQKLVNNVVATVESYKSILAALPTGPGIQEQLTFAMTVALDSLLYGRGDSSLTALLADLQTNNPEALALLDATYGGDGSAARSQEIADAMAAIAASLNSGALRRGQVLPADVRLAAQMQLSSLLKLFGDAFINGSASTASEAALGASWAQFSGAGAVPGAEVVIVFVGVTSTVLSIIDLIFNKIMVASMPTVIDSFTITLSTDTIAVSDTTVSSLKVYARNSPPQITLQDLLSQFQGIMGLLSPGGGATLLQQLEGTLNYLLGQFNNALQAYAAANPGFSYEPIFFDIAGVPIIHWEAEIADPRLLKLNALSPRLAVIDSLLEWRSTGDTGSATVTIAPSFSEDATLIPIPSFLGYVGSSFGMLSDSSAVLSSPHQITIHNKLVLLVDFAPTISQNGANVLGVLAGRIGTTGDTLYQAGLDVTLTVIGGGADPVTGTTDTSGQFNSLISLNPFSDSVEVVVTVTGSAGEFATKTVFATVGQQAQFTAATNGGIIGISNDGSQIDTIFNTTFARAYSWSPDGLRAIDVRAEVYSSSGTTTLPDPANRMLSGRIAWSPDGSIVYGQGHIFDDPMAAVRDTFVLVSIPVNGSPMNELYREIRDIDSSLLFGWPRPSHSGVKLAFAGFRSTRSLFSVRPTKHFIATMNANGGAPTVVVSHSVPWAVSISGLTWFPDDSRLAYSLPRIDTTTRPHRRWREIQVVNVASGASARISPTGLAPSGFDYIYQSPLVFPDGQSVLCERDGRNQDGVSDIVVLSSLGGLQTVLATDFTDIAGGLALSEDGALVAYTARVTGGGFQVKIIDAITGNVVGATSTFPGVAFLSWRP